MKVKKIISLVLALAFALSLIPLQTSRLEAANPFVDVPSSHWAYTYVNELKSRGITQGTSDNMFGLGKPISRYEFIAFLVRLMDWKLVEQPNPTFLDATDKKAWYYGPLETAVAHGILIPVGSEFETKPEVSKQNFGGNYPITRQEMAIMIVRALGYGQIASKLDLETSFTDVNKYQGYINMAKDLGIINGISQTEFAPTSSAKREEAAAMMIRMARKLDSKIKDLHAFYAISSYHQVNYLKDFNSVSFGWSRLGQKNQAGYYLDTTSDYEYDLAIPIGYEKPIQAAQYRALKTHLMVYANDSQRIGEGGNLTDFLSSPQEQDKVIGQIVDQISSHQLDLQGVVIDFEEMKGPAKKDQFVSFLTKLKQALNGKRLMVTVHPQREEGLAYYDAYDFRKIGDIADQVILKAYDYYAKSLSPQEMASGYTLTPLAPLDKVYYALRSITDPVSGVADKSKIMLQVSLDTVQWQKKDGRVLNQTAFQPTYSQVIAALKRPNVVINYSGQYSSPRASYFETDGVENIIWYEDGRSIGAKIQLAKMYGINNISIWRLGNIPNDKIALHMNIWDQVKKESMPR